MNTYYLITADEVETARSCAATDGLPHQLFGIRYNNDGSKAIVQAGWQETPPGTYLGAYIDGQAEQAVYDELTKAEWQSEE
jgi:hypothetical protein